MVLYMSPTKLTAAQTALLVRLPASFTLTQEWTKAGRGESYVTDATGGKVHTMTHRDGTSFARLISAGAVEMVEFISGGSMVEETPTVISYKRGWTS
jgi:hypothetical protein